MGSSFLQKKQSMVEGATCESRPPHSFSCSKSAPCAGQRLSRPSTTLSLAQWRAGLQSSLFPSLKTVATRQLGLDFFSLIRTGRWDRDPTLAFRVKGGFGINQ